MQKIVLDTGMSEKNITMKVIMLDILCRLFSGEPRYSTVVNSLNKGDPADPIVLMMKG